jgi:hypothetical protein
VTGKCRAPWRRRGITASSVAIRARSAQDNLGRTVPCRCRTATWWRSSRISASFPGRRAAREPYPRRYPQGKEQHEAQTHGRRSWRRRRAERNLNRRLTWVDGVSGKDNPGTLTQVLVLSRRPLIFGLQKETVVPDAGLWWHDGPVINAVLPAESASEPVFQRRREAPATGRNAYWPRLLAILDCHVRAGWMARSLQSGCCQLAQRGRDRLSPL